jgi:AraC-like DNA-binding protein
MFIALVEEPAMRYVTRWRRQVARSWLAEDGVTVGEVAGRLGYQSEAAFCRALKRVVGDVARRRRPRLITPAKARLVTRTNVTPPSDVYSMETGK